MPPVEGPIAAVQPAEAEKKNVIGFIYPPPEVRSILYYCTNPIANVWHNPIANVVVLQLPSVFIVNRKG